MFQWGVLQHESMLQGGNTCRQFLHMYCCADGDAQMPALCPTRASYQSRLSVCR